VNNLANLLESFLCLLKFPLCPEKSQILLSREQWLRRPSLIPQSWRPDVLSRTIQGVWSTDAGRNSVCLGPIESVNEI